ncbi:Endoribonuclease Dicer-like protein [Cardamine amara subsp. amara]|uniref:Endoribonuclease Dicer-like protein n=1 Tax=Cardamine amara subsp. amara TaxID=228776 RepID=A0ABD0Z2A8_CARAN
MHSVLEPENLEEEESQQGEGSNSLKRKFSEIDGDQTRDCSYELKVFEVVKKRNVIALLETGIDKLKIINMLIKDMGSSDKAKRLIIFLTPTVNLVKQQCCEIRAHMNLNVEEYFGAKGVDKWTSQRWDEEVSKHDVLVMTPQILLDALRSAFLKLEMVCLLVIDECHRTTGNHPYAKLMKEFYLKSTVKPKIFGLTASADIRKDHVSELESLMESQIFNPEEQKGVENFATAVKESPIIYDPPPFCTLEVKDNLKPLHLKVFEEVAVTQTMIDPPSRNELVACKKLRLSDASDNSLVQCSVKGEVVSSKSKSSSSAAGSKKRKELHGTTSANALSGTWGENRDGAVFQAYKLDFCCNISREEYGSFSLLIESTLAVDVSNTEIDLYLVKTFVKASVSPCGQIRLSHEEMVKAKCFQQFFFNGMFGKLFIGSKSLGTKREFLLQTDTTSLWHPSFMFLLLPVETKDLVSSSTVDWSAINSCASTVEFLKKNSLLEVQASDGNHSNTSPGQEVLLEVEKKETNLIHFANASSDKTSLKEIVVIAIHTGRIYSIVEAVKNSSAMSPFEDTTEYATYAEYFNKKYGIVLAHPNQPLMKLKQSHHAHNLLVNFNEDVILKKEPKAGNVRKRKPNIHAHLPPELLVRIDVPRAVLRSIYLLPSVMHRLESLMLASQLREEIGCSIDNFSISSTLILEAVTTLTCPEEFSMERLELLGDSVLKYVVSCYLFLKYPEKDEGQLSRQRQSIISNSNLHRLATNRKLQGYIRNGAFEPRRWIAPGQVSLFPAPCKCGIDTREVPLDPKFFTENMTIKIGKSCNMGHRWTVSKSVSDCAEALIGAYYVSGGMTAALHMMKWLGVNVDFDPNLVVEAINRASLRCYIAKGDGLAELEAKIQHKFSEKFLLKEAITHSSVHQSYSYERLEFLGDSVLDFLITRHLFNTYEQTGPGEMSDLRSACVNNENFAQVAVKHNLHTHLQRCATTLETQINEYLNSFSKPDEIGRSIPSIQGPKALGDLVESIAGALLIDTRLDLDEVWRVFEPLLSPLVTPDKLQLPPYRELSELCDSLGYFFRAKCVNDGVKAIATIQLQLDDVLLTEDGFEQTNKLALGKAASHLLKQLEKRNISRKVSIEDNLSSMDVNLATDCTHNARETPVLDFTGILGLVIPVIGPINMKKGGPRGTLHEFCKKHLWPMPTYNTSEEKSRTPFEFIDGDEKRTSFSSFVSTVTLKIPNLDAVMYAGEARPDKKSSFDSAVVELLYELERRKILTIKK